MTAPFYSLPVPYKGAQPPFSQPGTEQRSKRLWLGDPASAYGMIELPPPSKSNAPTSQRSHGKVVHGLFGGGLAVTQFASATRTFVYSWPTMLERDWQVLVGFDDGDFGTAPWALVEPEGVNRLTRNQSMCSASAWTPSSGSTLAASTQTPFITPGGVMQWTPTSTSQTLVAGTIISSNSAPDQLLGAPNIPAEFATFSFYARAVSGTVGVGARLKGCNLDGTGGTTISSSVSSVGTSWAPFTVTVAPGAFTQPYLVPIVVTSTTAAILICNPQLSYTSQTMDWAKGTGVPRVHITSEVPRSLTHFLRSGTSLTLSEAIPGAA